jgi:hypothetical protein
LRCGNRRDKDGKESETRGQLVAKHNGKRCKRAAGIRTKLQRMAVPVSKIKEIDEDHRASEGSERMTTE